MPVGKAGTGANFQGLAQYLRAGRDGKSPERVAWTAARNIVASRLEMAARIMQATAAENPRVEKPVYHLSINWPPEDQPTRDGMEIAVDRVLGDLGLEEHQAVLVAHNDTPHPHVHVMVNRVHPETYKTWDRKNDWRRIDRTLHYLEKELAWRQVPRWQLTEVERPRDARVTSGEHQQARRLGTPTPAQSIRDRAREVMREAKSWPQLEYRLHQEGLRLKRSGNGLVVTDGKHFTRASAVLKAASQPQLEKRFRQPYAAWRKERHELQRLARQLDRAPERNRKVAGIERRLRMARTLPEGRRQALERRAETLRGRKINPVKVYRRIRAFAVRWEERIVFWVSPTAGKVLRTYNRGTGALLRPVERGVERTLGRGR
jgi:hypothetical protein